MVHRAKEQYSGGHGRLRKGRRLESVLSVKTPDQRRRQANPRKSIGQEMTLRDGRGRRGSARVGLGGERGRTGDKVAVKACRATKEDPHQNREKVHARGRQTNGSYW